MDGIHPWTFWSWRNGTWEEETDGAVIEEGLVRIHLNGRELATFMCTPHDLEDLALGFLRSEGFITSLDDVRLLNICPNRNCVEVWLHDLSVEPPPRAIITSGCGGGITFDDLSARAEPLPLEETPLLTPEAVCALMQQLQEAATLYKQVRGVHTSALSDGERLLLVAEDVGRHNTIDRLWGQALQRGITTEGKMLLATGRISSEMLNKAAKMRVPVVISRTSATSLSVALGQTWGITVIGYVRRQHFRVYTWPQRVGWAHQSHSARAHPVGED